MAKVFSKREITRFCSQLQLLINAGVPLLEALSMIARLTKNSTYNMIAEKLSEGESLADAIAAYFPPMLKGAIESAERAGNLEEVLGRMSDYYKHQVEVEEKIKSSLLYPGLVLALCAFSILMLILFVIPDFNNMFRELGIGLPFFTALFINLYEAIVNYGIVSMVLFFIMIAIMAKASKTERGGAFLDSLRMKIRFLHEGQVLQSIRNLGSLLQGGIPMDTALALTAKAINNRSLKNIIMDLKKAVENGSELNRAFSQFPCFSTQIVNMVALGEKSGKLPEMLISAADFCEMEREVLIKRLVTLFEPTLTLVVGIVVAAVALAMFLPMMNMISSLQ